jgi:hypothetical protein
VRRTRRIHASTRCSLPSEPIVRSSDRAWLKARSSAAVAQAAGDAAALQISLLERGLVRNGILAGNYRKWLTKQPPESRFLMSRSA